MATVHNPPTPYVGLIQGGLSDGMQIHVSGIPEHHHNGFLISLQCGDSIDPRNECAFVFNPRFTDSQVVRNSLKGIAWEKEERSGGFPFQRDQDCEVIIYVTTHHFMVVVNGRHFCDFNHRMQKQKVSHITVEQGIMIKKIHFVGGHHPGGAGGYPGQPGQDAPIYNPVVPFVHNFGGLYPNKMIFIGGLPTSTPSRFTIIVQCGLSKQEIALQFDVRFSMAGDKHVIVTNARQGSGWGQEERASPYFPFSPDMYFDVTILVEQNMFKVAVNNEHLLEFAHRIHQLNRVDTLRIEGDVRLMKIMFQ